MDSGRGVSDRLSFPVATTWALALLLPLGLLLRTFAIERQSLWTDDGYSLEYSTCETLAACVAKILGDDSSEKFDIVFFLILHYWRELVGDGVVELRGLSVLFSVAALPVIWYAARSLFGERHALWSLAFASLSAFAIFYAHEIRPYAFLVFLTALQLALFADPGRPEPRGRRKLLFVIATFVCSWASVFSVAFSVALAAGHMAARRRVAPVVRWWLPVGLACVPAVLYYAYQTQISPPDAVMLQKTDVPHLNLLFVLYGHLVGQTYAAPLVDLRGTDGFAVLLGYWPLLLALVVVAGLLAWRIGRVIIASLSAPGGYAVRLLATAALTFVALCLALTITTHQHWLPRHAFPLHVLMALLLPLAAFVGGERARRLGLAALAGLLLLNLAAFHNYTFDPRHGRDDYRGLADHLKQQHAEGRPAVILVGKIHVLRFYGDTSTIDGVTFGRDQMPCFIYKATRGAPEVLIVVNREFSYESEDRYVRGWTWRGMVAGFMAPEYHIIDTSAFHYFTVYRFALVGGPPDRSCAE